MRIAAIRSAVVFASTLLLTQPVLATDLPVEGGPGGGYFRDDCSEEYAVGLYFRSGAWVDAIGMKCSSFNPKSGTFNTPPRDKPYHGGNGGALGVEGTCSNNTYFSGITHGYTREGNDNKFLNFVEMTCTPVVGGSPVRVCLETGKGCWVGREGRPMFRFLVGIPC